MGRGSLQNDINNLAQHMENGTNVKQVDFVLRLLDSEIDYAVSKQRIPGWTSWVLVASLATVFWLFLNEPEIVSLNVSNLILFFIYITVILDSVILLNNLFSSEYPQERSGPRFFLSLKFGKSRPFFFLMLIHHGLVIFLSTMVDKEILQYYKYGIYIFYGLQAFFVLVNLIFSYLRIPLSEKLDLSIKSSLIIFIVLIFFSVLLLVLSIYLLIYQSRLSDFAEIRVSGYLIAASYLILLLAQGSSDNPLITSLMGIRRELALGKIDLNSSIRETDIAIAGMRVEDVLQEDVRKILKLYEQIRIEFSELSKKRQIIDANLPDERTDTSSNEYKDKTDIVGAVSDAVGLNLNNIFELIGLLKKEYKSFDRRASFMAGMSSKAKEEIESIQEKLDSAHAELEAETKNMAQEWKTRKEQLGLLENKG